MVGLVPAIHVFLAVLRLRRHARDKPGHDEGLASVGCRKTLARLYGKGWRGSNMSDMRLIVAGAGGRMGRALTRVISDTPGAVLTGALEAPGSELLGKDAGMLAGLPENGVKLSADLWSLSANADGILDFTVPGATIANVAIAAERGLVHVIGTTGLSASDDAVIKSVTTRAIVVKSGNMSLGVNLLAALVKRVAQSLDESFDIEILEMHHKAKVDAPSGTALLLGEAAAEGRKIALDKHSARGRDGLTGARKAGDIGFASLRGGSVTGDHSVIFAGPMERIELTHRAEDRTMFAQGAVKAAMWARHQKPGFYSMADVLGLKDF
jgi:4-hydroxy-tetrahydrodipicolinate reductase